MPEKVSELDYPDWEATEPGSETTTSDLSGDFATVGTRIGGEDASSLFAQPLQTATA